MKAPGSMKRQNSISFDNQPSSNRPGTPMESGEASQPIPTPRAPPSVSRAPSSVKVVPDPSFRKGAYSLLDNRVLYMYVCGYGMIYVYMHILQSLAISSQYNACIFSAKTVILLQY